MIWLGLVSSTVPHLQLKSLQPKFYLYSPLLTLLYLNCSDGKGYFPPPIDIGVEYSQNVLELLRDH